MRAWVPLDCNAQRCTRPVHAHPSGHHVTPRRPDDPVARPHTEDGSHREVAVHNRRTIQRIEADSVPGAAVLHRDRILLGACDLAHVAVLQGIKQNPVSQHIHRKLLVAKNVRFCGAFRGALFDLRRDLPARISQRGHQTVEPLAATGHRQELIQAPSHRNGRPGCGRRTATHRGRKRFCQGGRIRDWFRRPRRCRCARQLFRAAGGPQTLTHPFMHEVLEARHLHLRPKAHLRALVDASDHHVQR
mmetsp:Transcript_129878/g.224542  ORF Transcript_129878/g.224542 Transcript_129878/m.224542 type:complete len:246 (+) Transcript_129878:1783-2520(+)